MVTQARRLRPVRRDGTVVVHSGPPRCGDAGGRTAFGLPCGAFPVAGSDRCRSHPKPGHESLWHRLGNARILRLARRLNDRMPHDDARLSEGMNPKELRALLRDRRFQALRRRLRRRGGDPGENVRRTLGAARRLPDGSWRELQADLSKGLDYERPFATVDEARAGQSAALDLISLAEEQLADGSLDGAALLGWRPLAQLNAQTNPRKRSLDELLMGAFQAQCSGPCHLPQTSG